jgi:hypothetical protein
MEMRPPALRQLLKKNPASTIALLVHQLFLLVVSN